MEYDICSVIVFLTLGLCLKYIKFKTKEAHCNIAVNALFTFISYAMLTVVSSC